MLVSALMPTRGRAEWAAQAVECFMAQTWRDKELVILDDSDDPSFDESFREQLYAYEGNIQYHRIEKRWTVGAKRNIACGRGIGNILIHWDSDDVSAPERIEDQVTRLIDSGAGITGYHSMKFFDVLSGEWWKYRGSKNYALGTSLCYTREHWKANPFPDVNVGEDNAIVHRSGHIVSVDAGDMMWARTHPGNTSIEGHSRKGEEWTKIET